MYEFDKNSKSDKRLWEFGRDRVDEKIKLKL